MDNADHLVGIAAECALKGALWKLNTPWSQVLFKNDGDIGNKGGLKNPQHIKGIWGAVRTIISGRQAGPLISLLDNQEPNPFDDWEVVHRYGPDGCVVEAILEKHYSAAQRCLEALDQITLGNLGGP